MTVMRLQRALARAGVASRRAAEDLIRADKVRVNGDVAHLGMSVDLDTDVITVQGRRITQSKIVWIALNKPIGYVVTRRDPEGRQTVFQLVPNVPGLTYVGRLDVMTTGLLLLTNDGGAAHRLMHPKFEVERTYRALVHGRSESEIRTAFAKGIVVDGRAVNVLTMKVRPAEESRGSLELLLVLAEGRYRIVRRICEQLDLKVERLNRLSYGPIRLGDLAPGNWRHLTPTELAALDSGKRSPSFAREVEAKPRSRPERSEQPRRPARSAARAAAKTATGRPARKGRSRPRARSRKRETW